jgi:amino acid transporter
MRRPQPVGISLLGERGGSIILSFVLIAILGVTNGVIMGMLRLPQALAEKNMLPNSAKVKRIDPKSQLSPAAAQIAFAICLCVDGVALSDPKIRVFWVAEMSAKSRLSSVI